MICIAKIEDHDRFYAWLEENKDKVKVCTDSPCSYDSLTIHKVKDIPGGYKKDDKISVESFLYGDASISLDELEQDDEIVIFDYIGDEGDGAFTHGHDWHDFEVDYDIDLDFFPDSAQEAYIGFETGNGLSMISKTFGAGRNG